MFFAANDGVNGYELWKSDGTNGGTVLVRDIFAGPDSSNPMELINVNGTLFMNATDIAARCGALDERWHKRWHGVSGDIRPGAIGSAPANLTNVNGTLFMCANDGTTSIELWRSDGTEAGTTLVRDILPGANSGLLLPDGRKRHAVLQRITERSAQNFGRATVRKPAPCWSATSGPVQITRRSGA